MSVQRKYKSGAQKRKERKQRAAAPTNNKTLFNVGVTVVSNQNDEDEMESQLSKDSDACNYLNNSDHDDSDIARSIDEEDPEDESCMTNDEKSFSEPEDSPDLDVQLGVNSSSNDANEHDYLDIGNLSIVPTCSEIEHAVTARQTSYPEEFPKDKNDKKFPKSILKCREQNGDCSNRDWVVWSPAKKAIFCFPCRLFKPGLNYFGRPQGWSGAQGWRKLYRRVPEHERSITHRKAYLEWRALEARIKNDSGIDCQVRQEIASEITTWREILRRVIDVVLFLGERGLAFRGSSQRIGCPHNGNFLGFLEVLGKYDPLLQVHLNKVCEAQKQGNRLAVHYLSSDSQNDFISACASQVRAIILEQQKKAKYFSIIVDATPDSSHIEQTTFILRYVSLPQDEVGYKIQESFLKFVDCNKKTGSDIAELILSTLLLHDIPIKYCRGQGYDNGSNMAGKYKGAQAHILQCNNLAVFSPCACHSLNLCGSHAAECCEEVQTFFGTIQKFYNLFSSSPARWEILLNNIGCSLHSLSHTRWSDRLDSVKPIATHITGLKPALNDLLTLNLTSEAKADVKGLTNYVNSFHCLLLASIWYKVLAAIDIRNKVLQARNATIDVEVKNVCSLIDDLKSLRDNWELILSEVKIVAQQIGIVPELPSKRKRKSKRFHDEVPTCADEWDIEPTEEDNFKRNVFYNLIDSVIAGLTERYKAVKAIESTFSFLWQYSTLSEDEIRYKGKAFVDRYKDDVSDDLVQEIIDLKSIHPANFGEQALPPFELLNKLYEYKLQPLFCNCSIALRIFCTIPATVAEAERSFSKLKSIKNYLRTTMTQQRISDLGILAIEHETARKVDYDNVIDFFAKQKARKAHLI